jgi:hypothetical protein
MLSMTFVRNFNLGCPNTSTGVNTSTNLSQHEALMLLDYAKKCHEIRSVADRLINYLERVK